MLGNKQKIIALSSTHGTSKSTLSYRLAGKMKMAGHNVVVLDELARKCPFPINKGAVEETQQWLVSRQIATEFELMQKADFVIADRSIMDAFCYNKVLDVMDLSHYIPVICKHIEHYYKDIFVLNKDAFNYQFFDGVRDLDNVFRDKVYDELINLYDGNKIKYRIIYTPEELFDVVL